MSANNDYTASNLLDFDFFDKFEDIHTSMKLGYK